MKDFELTGPDLYSDLRKIHIPQVSDFRMNCYECRTLLQKISRAECKLIYWLLSISLLLELNMDFVWLFVLFFVIKASRW